MASPLELSLHDMYSVQLHGIQCSVVLKAINIDIMLSHQGYLFYLVLFLAKNALLQKIFSLGERFCKSSQGMLLRQRLLHKLGIGFYTMQSRDMFHKEFCSIISLFCHVIDLYKSNL